MFTSRPPDLASALASLAVLLVVLAVHGWLARRAIADLGRDDVEARYWSKAAWFLVIVLGPVIGPLAWLSFGREDRG